MNIAYIRETSRYVSVRDAQDGLHVGTSVGPVKSVNLSLHIEADEEQHRRCREACLPLVFSLPGRRRHRRLPDLDSVIQRLGGYRTARSFLAHQREKIVLRRTWYRAGI